MGGAFRDFRPRVGISKRLFDDPKSEYGRYVDLKYPNLTSNLSLSYPDFVPDQTIAFTRRINAAMERLALTAIWRNFIKKRSERRSDVPPPAVELGLTDSRWSWKRALSRRLFFGRCSLQDPWPALYRREWTTAVLPANARHDRVRSF